MIAFPNPLRRCSSLICSTRTLGFFFCHHPYRVSPSPQPNQMKFSVAKIQYLYRYLCVASTMHAACMVYCKRRLVVVERTISVMAVKGDSMHFSISFHRQNYKLNFTKDFQDDINEHRQRTLASCCIWGSSSVLTFFQFFFF